MIERRNRRTNGRPKPRRERDTVVDVGESGITEACMPKSCGNCSMHFQMADLTNRIGWMDWQQSLQHAERGQLLEEQYEQWILYKNVLTSCSWLSGYGYVLLVAAWKISHWRPKQYFSPNRTLLISLHASDAFPWAVLYPGIDEGRHHGDEQEMHILVLQPERQKKASRLCWLLTLYLMCRDGFN